MELADRERRLATAERERQPAAEAELASAFTAVCNEFEREDRERRATRGAGSMRVEAGEEGVPGRSQGGRA